MNWRVSFFVGLFFLNVCSVLSGFSAQSNFTYQQAAPSLYQQCNVNGMIGASYILQDQKILLDKLVQEQIQQMMNQSNKQENPCEPIIRVINEEVSKYRKENDEKFQKIRNEANDDITRGRIGVYDSMLKAQSNEKIVQEAETEKLKIIQDFINKEKLNIAITEFNEFVNQLTSDNELNFHDLEKISYYIEKMKKETDYNKLKFFLQTFKSLLLCQTKQRQALESKLYPENNQANFTPAPECAGIINAPQQMPNQSQYQPQPQPPQNSQ